MLLLDNIDHSLHGAGEAVQGAVSRSLDTTAGTLVAARIGSHVADNMHVFDPPSLPGMVAGVIVQPWFAVVPITLAVARIIMLALKKTPVSTDPKDRAKLRKAQPPPRMLRRNTGFRCSTGCWGCAFTTIGLYCSG